MVEKPTVVAWMDETSAWRGPNAPTAPGTYALMDVAQHERIVAGLEASLQEAEKLLKASRDVLYYRKLHSPTGDKIDAFLAQTAEGVE